MFSKKEDFYNFIVQEYSQELNDYDDIVSKFVEIYKRYSEDGDVYKLAQEGSPLFEELYRRRSVGYTWMLTQKLESLRNDVEHLKGSDYEKSIPTRISKILNSEQLRRPHFLKCPLHGVTNELSSMLDRAEKSQEISRKEHARIVTTDIILKALAKGDSSEVWVAIEVSMTVTDYDVERASKSTKILKKILDKQIDVRGVVVGVNIPPQQEETAQNENVKCIQMKLKRF